MAALATLPAWLSTVLVGALFLASFAGLAALRRQKPPIRFLAEGGILTTAAAALCLLGAPPHPILFLVILYLATMRVRLLVDLSNVLTGRRRFRAALAAQDLALRIGPDPASRQVALISRGVTQLRMGEPQAAYFALRGVMLGEGTKLAARERAAGYYNLGVGLRAHGPARGGRALLQADHRGDARLHLRARRRQGAEARRHERHERTIDRVPVNHGARRRTRPRDAIAAAPSASQYSHFP